MASILVPGTYLIPGVGEIVITASLAILLGKTIIDAGTEIYTKVESGLQIYFSKKAEEAKKKIPARLKDDDGNVKLDKFNEKVSGNSVKKKEKGGWVIEKDGTQHGGSKWKLKDSDGKRVASLDENGKDLRN